MEDPFMKLDAELNRDESEEKRILDEEKELRKTFRRVFMTEDGKKVFNVLMNDLKFFDQAKNERDIALKNYAVFLLCERMGYNDTISLVENILNSKNI